MTQHQAGVLVTAQHLFITIFILPWLDLQKMMPLEAIKFALANWTREQAFAKLKEDNKHRLDSLDWYFKRLNLDPVEVIE